jgi:hypothetical protein
MMPQCGLGTSAQLLLKTPVTPTPAPAAVQHAMAVKGPAVQQQLRQLPYSLQVFWVVFQGAVGPA